MTPIEDLIREHRELNEMLEIMNDIAIHIKAKNVFETRDVEFVVDFLINYADKCHHSKEETVLFPALETAGMKIENGPLAAIIHEHALSRVFIKEMNSSVEKCKLGLPFSCELVADSMSRYVDLLVNHFVKEEKYLFPLIDKLLDIEMLNSISSQFNSIDMKIMGEGKLIQSVEQMRQLKAKYQQQFSESN